MHEGTGLSFQMAPRRGRADSDRGKDAEAAEILAAIVEHSNDAIFSRTMDGKITSWNAAAERMFGYSARQIIGRSSRLLVPPDRSDELGDLLGRIRGGEVIKCFETERLRRDGCRLWISLTASPIRNAAGELVGVSSIARDITQERRAQEAVLRSERELAEMFEYAPFALFCVNSDGMVKRFNNTAKAWLELSSQSGFSRSLADFFVDPKLFDKLLKRLRGRQTVSNLQTRFRGSQGTIRTVLIYANGVWEDGQLLHTYWFLRDVTARRQLEQELLAISERERQRFARELHDGLGQHLSGVAYLADCLVEQLAERESRETAAAQRLKQLLEQSVELTRGVAHGLLPVHPEPEGLMIALRAMATQTAEVFGVKCRFTCRKPVVIEDEATAGHLYRIAQEAVHNAIRHGKAKRIDIILNRNRQRLLLAVRDNGAGIGPLTPRRKGMGLHMMRYRAALFNGALSIEPRSPSGTEVKCIIDLRVTRAAPNSRAIATHREISPG
jgi:PAS domain S-box-containing protein